MKIYKLKELAKIEISGVDKKSIDGEQSVRLCNFVDVYHNWAITHDLYDDFMAATARPNEIERFKLKKGQVAFTKDSETRYDIGIPTYIAEDFDDVILGYHNALVTPDESRLNGKYLNALMHTDYAKKYWACNASGSGQRYALSVEALESFPIPLPSLEEQKRIGNIFSALDKKICLNKQINQNLETMIKQLFEYWFLQYDFPNKQGKPYRSNGGLMTSVERRTSNIPEGWEIRRFKDFVNIFTGKKDVSKVIPGDYKFFSCAPDPITSNEFIYDGEAILISGNGSYTGRVSFYKGKMDLYQRTYGCSLKVEESIMPFLYCTMKFVFQPLNSGGKHGSSIPYIVLGDLADFEIPYNKEMAVKFSEKISPLFYTLMTNKNEEIENLTKQRDELLPLLMNGQVSVTQLNSDLSLD